MSKIKKPTNINIETLVLVAVWEQPFIFQGCFRITELSNQNRVLLFFRCEYEKPDQIAMLNNDFSPHDYQFSHLYNESNLIQLNSLDQAKEYAIYLLKYALHTTLLEMITSQKQRFVLIDDIAMQAMIKRIEPILSQGAPWSQEEDDIGFAASIDFYPKEEMGQLAVSALLTKFEDRNYRDGEVKIH